MADPRPICGPEIALQPFPTDIGPQGPLPPWLGSGGCPLPACAQGRRLAEHGEGDIRRAGPGWGRVRDGPSLGPLGTAKEQAGSGLVGLRHEEGCSLIALDPTWLP